MKFIIFNSVFFLTLFTCCSSFAQLEQGTFVINEHFDFILSNTDIEESSNQLVIAYTSKQKSYDFNTSFGFLIKDNQEIGVSFGIGREKFEIKNTDSDNKSERINNNYGILFYHTKYINLNDKLYFLFSQSVGYEYDTGDYTRNNYFSNSNSARSNHLGISINTGFLYNITPKFGLNANFLGVRIQYSSSKGEGRDGYSSKTQTLSSNFYNYFGFGGLNLGVQFML